ncbi:pyridoxal-phosphate dependent enzyme [Fragilaria crotonensis]|nr:pyridoxal-phosphate dependent enzyme [Fragilaria crotonensis]
MFTTVLVRRSAAVVARRRSNVLPNATRSFSAHDDSSKADNEAVVPSPAVDERERDRIIRDNLPVTFADISRAHVAIRDGVVRTKCEKSVFLSEIIGANIYLKPEFRQFTGSFKERGARNAILKLKNRDPASAQRGVIAASAGNHALALAYHGRELGIPVTVVMPTVAPLAKVDKCRKFGARIIIEGMHRRSKTYAETLVQSEGLTYVNGYDDPPIIAGAGTIGIELIDDVPNVDIVVVPVGGAGLIAGIACSVKTLKPEARVIGVEPEFCASYIGALKAGKPVQVPMTPTLADGLAVPMVGPHAFEVARHYVDECVTCTEKEISLAVLRLIEQEKMVVEGGGASV